MSRVQASTFYFGFGLYIQEKPSILEVWMTCNKFRLNTDKTVTVILVKSRKLQKLHFNSITVDGDIIAFNNHQKLGCVFFFIKDCVWVTLQTFLDLVFITYTIVHVLEIWLVHSLYLPDWIIGIFYFILHQNITSINCSVFKMLHWD